MGACGLDDVGPGGLLDGVDFDGLLNGFEADLESLEVDLSLEVGLGSLEVDLNFEVDLGSLEADLWTPELGMDPDTWGLDLGALGPFREGR